MRKWSLLAILMSAVSAQLSTGQSWAQAPDPIFLPAGEWTPLDRADFYTRDQGSKVIPFAWLQGLKQPNGDPFAENLTRYGYLPNPASKERLPVGFMVSGSAGARSLGMNCAACHTRQITVEGRPYRIDGGPAFADFQSFLTDLDTAVGNVLKDDASFRAFATKVFAPAPVDAADVAELREEVEAWYKRYHTLMERALPKPPAQPWGPARLDAVGMIFNRLTGLDLGKPEDFFLIPDNIRRADAPTRYPFLWNVSKQDKTQWPGFAENGDDILALARNLGQVLGVFGVFEPRREGLIFDFLHNNSANFDGLGKLEDLVKQIGPPTWSWGYDVTLAAKGKEIYEWSTARGGCADCHGEKKGQPRLLNPNTWATPVMNVGTDTREYDVLAWKDLQTGALEGAFIPLITPPLGRTDSAFNILRVSVLGSIIEHTLTRGLGQQALRPGSLRQKARVQFAQHLDALKGLAADGQSLLPPRLRDLEHAYNPPAGSQIQEAPVPGVRPEATRSTTPVGAYEARVLKGIWAAAPYLHNGSVPTLAELLKPPAERVATFKIGPAYDRDNVGLAVEQPQSTFTLQTTDCSNLKSGNSRCGHEYGTKLSPEEKKALLEYLKIL